jgi:hypothetical protein
MVPVQAVAGVLLAARSRLLEFLLELRAAAPQDGQNGGTGEVQPEEVTKLVDQNIYHNITVNVGGQTMTNQEIKARDVNVAGSGNFVAGDITNSFNAAMASEASDESAHNPLIAKTMLRMIIMQGQIPVVRVACSHSVTWAGNPIR